MAYSITVQYDPENQVFFTCESDIPGLNVETRSLDEFVEVALDLAPDLLPEEAVIAIDFHVAGLSRVPVAA